MFTGIVDHCGVITHIQPTSAGLTLSIQHQFNDLALGESIAVDGICLTVTEDTKQIFQCDLSPETIQLTTAQYFQVDHPVNLERSLRMQDRLGGHFVMGHVDGMWTVDAIEQHADFCLMRFSGVTAAQQPYLTHKGSVSINGVSLTLNKVAKDFIEVMLIPHTLARTDLQHLKRADRVNVEFDAVARIVVKNMQLTEELAHV